MNYQNNNGEIGFNSKLERFNRYFAMALSSVMSTYNFINFY